MIDVWCGVGTGAHGTGGDQSTWKASHTSAVQVLHGCIVIGCDGVCMIDAHALMHHVLDRYLEHSDDGMDGG